MYEGHMDKTKGDGTEGGRQRGVWQPVGERIGLGKMETIIFE